MSSVKMKAMFIRRPTLVEATRWHRMGDHPAVGQFFSVEAEEFCKQAICCECGVELIKHGWVETNNLGERVCPGDWVVNEEDGTVKVYTPTEFAKCYDKVRTVVDVPEQPVHVVCNPKDQDGCEKCNPEWCGFKDKVETRHGKDSREVLKDFMLGDFKDDVRSVPKKDDRFNVRTCSPEQCDACEMDCPGRFGVDITGPTEAILFGNAVRPVPRPDPLEGAKLTEGVVEPVIKINCDGVHSVDFDAGMRGEGLVAKCGAVGNKVLATDHRSVTCAKCKEILGLK